MYRRNQVTDFCKKSGKAGLAREVVALKGSVSIVDFNYSVQQIYGFMSVKEIFKEWDSYS